MPVSAVSSSVAFLAWFRMGNLKKWGGPMPRSFLGQQHALQLQILPRLQALGIIGVLPAFAGFVPDALRYAYPNASIARGAQWLSGTSVVDPSVTGEQFSGPDILEAQDPLFQQIGAAFLSGYREAYAEANYSLQHYYSADTFNENAPPSSDPGFLKNYSTATYSAMAGTDGESVWVTQAWAFGASYWTNDRLEAYLAGVSNSSMLMLDLVSDQMPLWDGQWAELHNLMPAKCCKTNASASCADCDGEGDEHCCDPAAGTGGWTGLAKTHNYKNYFGKDWIYCALNNYGGYEWFRRFPTLILIACPQPKTDPLSVVVVAAHAATMACLACLPRSSRLQPQRMRRSQHRGLTTWLALA